MAFCDIDGAMDNAEQYVKFVVRRVLETCSSDIDFFTKFVDPTLRERLTKVVSVPFHRLSYRDAVALLQEEIAKDPSKWEYKDVKFGSDLQTEHERWLAEKKFQSAVFVHHYPRSIKSFYMKDSADGETVD